MTDNLPFVLSLSKHERWFFSRVSLTPNLFADPYLLRALRQN